MSRTPVVNGYYDMTEEKQHLITLTNKIMDSEKGFLGIDENTSAFDQRFFNIDKHPNEREDRRLYRQFICAAPLQEQFSGAILSDEFMKQSDDEAIDFTDILLKKGLVLGIRIDTGVSLMYGTKGEYMGMGLLDLNDRLRFYKDSGCKFTKWRTVFQINEKRPTLYSAINNANKVAKFAIMSQNNGLVPIVSVEVLPDGIENINMARRVLQKLLINVMNALNHFNVLLEATVLQVSFVQAGRQSVFAHSLPENIAGQTLEAFQKSVPIAIGGIMFHSSGLSEECATQSLNHVMVMKRRCQTMVPWKMTFGFGRALQASGIVTWKWDPDFEEVGQKQIMMRATANNLALKGEYKAGSVKGAASDMDLFLPNYTH